MSTRKHRKSIRSNTFRKTDKPIVVGKIYAEWCGHCQDLKPKWEMMCSNVKKHANEHNPNEHKYKFMAIEQSNEQAQVGHVNSTYLNHSAKKLALQGGYPTLFKIQDGELEYYNGNRETDLMTNWALGNSQKGGKSTKARKASKSAGTKTRKNKSWFSFFTHLKM
jgi:thiol-disulfide isomerase/thioredoxin